MLTDFMSHSVVSVSIAHRTKTLAEAFEMRYIMSIVSVATYRITSGNTRW